MVSDFRLDFQNIFFDEIPHAFMKLTNTELSNDEHSEGGRIA